LYFCIGLSPNHQEYTLSYLFKLNNYIYRDRRDLYSQIFLDGVVFVNSQLSLREFGKY